jgi:hypothetical protein
MLGQTWRNGASGARVVVVAEATLLREVTTPVECIVYEALDGAKLGDKFVMSEVAFKDKFYRDEAHLATIGRDLFQS